MFQGERVRPPYRDAQDGMAWQNRSRDRARGVRAAQYTSRSDLIKKQGTKLEAAGLGPATGAVELAGGEPDTEGEGEGRDRAAQVVPSARAIYGPPMVADAPLHS
jgi:hypothetical protein